MSLGQPTRGGPPARVERGADNSLPYKLAESRNINIWLGAGTT